MRGRMLDVPFVVSAMSRQIFMSALNPMMLTRILLDVARSALSDDGEEERRTALLPSRQSSDECW